jgi:RND family efflux transporter MFP subunit
MNDTAQLLRSLAIDRQKETGGPPTGGPGRWPVLALIATSAIITGGAALWFALPPNSTPPPGKAPPASQETSQARTPPVIQEPRRVSSLIASGYAVARRKAVVASEITGKIVELLVEEGMAVQPGQALARLDSVLVEKDLALARSRVEVAEAAREAIAAELRDAERILNRTRSLSQESFASEAALSKAEAHTEALRAQLRQSEAQLAVTRLDVQRTAATLEKHLIRAPSSGVVVERNAQAGEMITLMSGGGFTRTGICTIVDMDSIEFEVDVNEAFIGRVHAGASASAVLDAYPDLTIPASVIAIIPTANREKATVKVRVGLKQKDPRILPDMAVKVTFPDETSAMAVSASVAKSNNPD